MWLRLVPYRHFEFFGRFCMTQTWSQTDVRSRSLLSKASTQKQKIKSVKAAPEDK
jgi:hypothetical protein